MDEPLLGHHETDLQQRCLEQMIQRTTDITMFRQYGLTEVDEEGELLGRDLDKGLLDQLVDILRNRPNDGL